MMYKLIGRETFCYQSVSERPLARHARQWATGTGLAAGAVMAAAVVSLTTTPAAHADTTDPGLITTIDQYIAQYAGVADVSDIPALQSTLVNQITGEQATITGTTSPTVTDYMNLLSSEAHLATVNTAVDYGNADYLSTTNPAAFQEVGNEIQVLPPQVAFENQMQNFYNDFPTLTSKEETDGSLLSATQTAVGYQADLNHTVLNIGGLDGIAGDQFNQLNADNLLLINYDTDLFNQSGWIADLFVIDSALGY